MDREKSCDCHWSWTPSRRAKPWVSFFGYFFGVLSLMTMLFILWEGIHTN